MSNSKEFSSYKNSKLQAYWKYYMIFKMTMSCNIWHENIWVKYIVKAFWQWAILLYKNIDKIKIQGKTVGNQIWLDQNYILIVMIGLELNFKIVEMSLSVLSKWSMIEEIDETQTRLTNKTKGSPPK